MLFLFEFNYQKFFDNAFDFAINAVMAVLIIVIGFWAVNRVIKVLDNIMQSRGMDDNIRPFLRTLVDVALKVMLLFTAAGIVGLLTMQFTAVLAAAGFAIGLALQGSLSNFAGGVLILIFKPFRKGDYITAQGHSGYVEEIQIFNTVLYTLEDRTISIPNGQLSNSSVSNHTKNDMISVSVTVVLDPKENIDRAREILLIVGEQYPNLIPDQHPEVQFVSIGDGGAFKMSLKVWVKNDALDHATSWLGEAAKRALDLDNIIFDDAHIPVKLVAK